MSYQQFNQSIVLKVFSRLIIGMSTSFLMSLPVLAMEETTLETVSEMIRSPRIEMNKVEPISDVLEGVSFKIEDKKQFVHSIEDDEFNLIRGGNFKLIAIGLFAGDDLISNIIRKVTNSHISHCSLILEDETGEWYNFESTGSYDDIIHHGILPQVQIHLWKKVVEIYGGAVYFRQFTFQTTENNKPEVINPIIMENLGKSYETNLISLLEAVGRDNKVEDISTLFCSELVAYFLKKTGYIGSSELSDNYLPKDFSTDVGANLCLIGALLGDEILAKSAASNSNDHVKSSPWCGNCVTL